MYMLDNMYTLHVAFDRNAQKGHSQCIARNRKVPFSVSP